ncbi:MAG TPA: ABC transporter permease [Phototrophicaceae bacterium]|nr:ABC transporter permease [Phototrophicaceae bacterium]
MSESQTAPAALTPTKRLNVGEARSGMSLLGRAMYRLRRDTLTLIALGVLLLLVVISALAPIISRDFLNVDPDATNGYAHMLPLGTPGHVLGTDNIGRDQLSRLMFAGQVSLGIAVVGGVLSIGIGLILGVMAGYFGGRLDDLINWVIATINSIPALFLLLIIAAILRPGPTALIIVFGLIGWTFTTRLVRGETLSLRERDFIVAARAVGASDWHIMFLHIIPNVISITIVNLAITMGDLILVESALSFLGVGIQPPTPTWGNMLSNAQSFFKTGAYLIIPPGLLIVVTVLCLYVVGDGLRDALDPTINNA